jgi:hypothetical protein
LNLNKAIELLDAVSAFNFGASNNRPSVSIFCNKKDKCMLCIKASLVGEGYRQYLEDIAESQKLNIRESEGYLMIHNGY